MDERLTEFREAEAKRMAIETQRMAIEARKKEIVEEHALAAASQEPIPQDDEDAILAMA